MEVKGQLLMIISMQLSRIEYRIVEEFVEKQLFEASFPAERVCLEIEQRYLPEWERRTNCTNECVDKIDLSLERLLKVVMKCQMDLECYMMEVQEELMNVQACSDECYQKPRIVAQLAK